MSNNIMQCCKNCADRKYKCHGVCEKYQAYKRELSVRKEYDTAVQTLNNGYYSIRARRYRYSRILVERYKCRGVK